MRYMALAILSIGAGLGRADVFSGVLDPASNPNLTTWDQYGPAYVAPFAGPTDWERAYNIAVHPFSVSAAGVVNFASKGYSAGGFDPVLSVFHGVGNAAVYLGHQYSPSGLDDFDFDLNLDAGAYLLAVSVTFNEPCATGYCRVDGTFGDGFTNLVNYDSSRSLYYEVTVTELTGVPEPATGWLAAVAAAVLLARKRPSRS